MGKNKTKSSDAAILRNKAEEQLKIIKGITKQPLAEAETIKLLHELQVHQIELEMMNEELRHARDRAEVISEKFEELYDFAPAGYLTLLSDGIISELNLSAARMLGTERSNIVNTYFRNFVSLEFLSVFDEYFRKVIEKDEKVSFELMLSCTDFNSIFVLCEGKSFANGSKCLLSMIDITKRRHAEEALNLVSKALKTSNTELEQFAYAVSHDLQEPLRMISSYTSLLKEKLKGTLDETNTEFMEFIIDGAKRMSSLIQDLLKYAHVSSQNTELSPIDLNKVKEGILKDLNLAISDSKAVIKSDKLPTIKANSAQMRQLFQNLIANAIKFRGDNNPVINITVERTRENITFCVRDNGIGISPKYSDRIFKIFQRLHEREKYSGTGIGLALCKKIVENHGGSIWVESEEDKGAAFYFTLPDK